MCLESAVSLWWLVTTMRIGVCLKCPWACSACVIVPTSCEWCNYDTKQMIHYRFVDDEMNVETSQLLSISPVFADRVGLCGDSDYSFGLCWRNDKDSPLIPISESIFVRDFSLFSPPQYRISCFSKRHWFLNVSGGFYCFTMAPWSFDLLIFDLLQKHIFPQCKKRGVRLPKKEEKKIKDRWRDQRSSDEPSEAVLSESRRRPERWVLF